MDVTPNQHQDAVKETTRITILAFSILCADNPKPVLLIALDNNRRAHWRNILEAAMSQAWRLPVHPGEGQISPRNGISGQGEQTGSCKDDILDHDVIRGMKGSKLLIVVVALTL